MNDPFDTQFEPLKKLRLTNQERVSMRNHVHAYMREHVARIPFIIRVQDLFTNWRASRSGKHVTLQMHPALASLVMVFFVGIGTSYAAESSLPGDPLYAVKTQVNEKVRGALASSETAKLDWSAQLTNRRFQEAEALAAEGRLTPETRTKIENGLAVASEDFDANLAGLGAEKAGDAEDAATDLDANISAHADVLAALSVALPDVRSEVAPILAFARDRAHRGKRAIRAVVVKSATDARVEAISAPVAMTMTIEATTSTSSATVDQNVERADAQIEQGDLVKALGVYQNAIQEARKSEGTDAADTLKARLEKVLKKHKSNEDAHTDTSSDVEVHIDD
ncbi:hypothetical protein HY968_00725 [Candidatus Kaiserbacteria bacterium]|nr:hypothetical protein [Candidatus Kaiserbacteria bacterium]